MIQMTDDIKEILKANISYFATTSRDNKPNVVPVGLVEPISDSEILIVDVLFNKTRKNLEENPQVSLAVTDLNRLRAHQLKGRAEIITSGQLFDRTSHIMKEKSAKRNKMMQERFKDIQDSELKKRYQRMLEMHKRLKPKAVILVKLEEIYATM